MKEALTSEKETAFQRLYRTDPNFRTVADVAKGNGWSEAAIVQEWLLDAAEGELDD